MKEIEIKILEIDPQDIRKHLKSHSAKFVKKVFQQNFLYRNDYTKKNKVVVRIRKEGNKGKEAIFTLKANGKIIRNHKVLDEYEFRVDASKIEKILDALGLKIWAATDIKREYWKLYGCSIEICKIPRLPPFIEIEGDEKDILKAARALGFDKHDFMAKSIFKHYNISDKQRMSMKFSKFK